MPDPPARVILPAPWAPRTRLLAAPASDAPHSRARRRARLLPAPATSLIDARKVPRVPPQLRHPHADCDGATLVPQDLPSAWCGLASESRGPAWRSVPRAAIRRSPETVWGHPPTHPVGTAENGVFHGFAYWVFNPSRSTHGPVLHGAGRETHRGSPGPRRVPDRRRGAVPSPAPRTSSGLRPEHRRAGAEPAQERALTRESGTYQARRARKRPRPIHFDRDTRLLPGVSFPYAGSSP